MNDDFLYQLRPEVPSDLAETIRERIARQFEKDKRVVAGTNNPQRVIEWFTAHRIFAIGIIIVLLAGCVAAVKRISEFIFEETTEYPYTGQVSVYQKTVDREEILSELTFTVNFPSWVPMGYNLLDEVMVTLPDEDVPLSEAWQIWLYWENNEMENTPRKILLLAFPAKYERGVPVPVGPDALEETEINGYPAVVIRGSWVENRQDWDERMGLGLRWIQGETSYWLQSFWVPIEDLVRMAESIP